VIGRGARALLFFTLLAAPAGCGPAVPPPPPPPPPVPLSLDPACGLAPAAGLQWIVAASPREVAQVPDLIPAIGTVVPEARFRAFAEAHGGVDLRQVQSLCVAHYQGGTLVVARTPFDPARVERAFTDHVTREGGRAVDVPNPPVVRIWGEVSGEPREIVLFGRDAIAMAQGKPAHARVAEAFALGKLHRVAPALKGAALMRAQEVLGDAPVRVFAPGPFEGDTARGLGGLLRASTAIAASARYDGSDPATPTRVAVRLVLMGAWDKDGPAAAERLAAAVHVLTESSLGRLFGVNVPIEAPHVRATEDALVLDAVLDGGALARGLHDALDADVAEILGR